MTDLVICKSGVYKNDKNFALLDSGIYSQSYLKVNLYRLDGFYVDLIQNVRQSLLQELLFDQLRFPRHLH